MAAVVVEHRWCCRMQGSDVVLPTTYHRAIMTTAPAVISIVLCRRRWTAEEKMIVLDETLRPGSTKPPLNPPPPDAHPERPLSGDYRSCTTGTRAVVCND